jgi:transcriptional regulator with XRE-family HTH domain
MTPKQIQIKLRREYHLTQNDLANELGVSKVSISQVIRKKMISRRLMEAVAARIETPLREVFPEYFGLEEPEDQDLAA